jgi:4-amino-4-deoxy-L-arabinose transferase-like glycosyltransferase
MAYSEWPIWIKVLVGLLGLLLPFLLLLSKFFEFSIQLNDKNDNFELGFASWTGILLLLAMVFLRFYKLSTFSTWPSTDEGWFGSYALDLYEKWNWNILFGYVKFSMLNFWVETAFFKLFGPSLFSMYLIPAIVSLFTVFLTYITAREFFSKSFSILCGLINAFTFWPLLLGRIAVGGAAIPGLELIGLFLLSRIFKNEKRFFKNILAMLLGLVLVCGFYYFLYSWATYWAWMHFFIIWWVARDKKSREWLKVFLLTEVVLLIPLGLAFLSNGLGQYVNGLLLFNKQSVWRPDGFNSLCYLTSFLWGADKSGLIYRPQWGGFLNPLSGSFFLFGLVILIKRWKEPVWRWVLLAFPFFLLPGLLSQTFEMYRIVAMIPLVGLTTVLGVRGLWNFFPEKKYWFLMLFLISLSLDTYHLFGVYRRIWAVPGAQWKPFKSLERWRVFEILEGENSVKGPGLIFSDFVVRNFDRTLDLATYSFNCDRNQKLAQTKPQWVAIVFPLHLTAFLSRRFLDGKWYGLSDELPDSFENKCLGIIPYSDKNKAVFDLWRIANRDFREVNRKMLYSENQMTFQEYENDLISIRGDLGNDPFLESCFDQKMLGAFNNNQPQKELFFVQRALKYGYPSVFFKEELYNLQKLKKN